MKINKIRFKDNKQNWELSETSFERFTLLVGASGVGKTKIIRAIDTIKQIALGLILPGVEWYIDLTTNNGDSYIWEGETDISGVSLPVFTGEFVFSLGKDTPETSIKWEKIYLNNELILNRNLSETLYKDSKTVKFVLNESIVSILKEEDSIKPIVEELKKIRIQDLSSNNSNKRRSNLMDSIILQEDNVKYSAIDEIRNSRRGLYSKLLLTDQYFPEIFAEIKERYIDIFPLVEDVKIEVRDSELSKKEEKIFLLVFS